MPLKRILPIEMEWYNFSTYLPIMLEYLRLTTYWLHWIWFDRKHSATFRTISVAKLCGFSLHSMICADCISYNQWRCWDIYYSCSLLLIGIDFSHVVYLFVRRLPEERAKKVFSKWLMNDESLKSGIAIITQEFLLLLYLKVTSAWIQNSKKEPVKFVKPQRILLLLLHKTSQG